jgi:hypothetical protein
MKAINWIKVAGIFFMAIGLLRPADVHCQGIMPPPDPDFLLDSWEFNDTTWVSDFGDGPLNFTNLNNPPSFDGNALQVDSTIRRFYNTTLLTILRRI